MARRTTSGVILCELKSMMTSLWAMPAERSSPASIAAAMVAPASLAAAVMAWPMRPRAPMRAMRRDMGLFAEGLEDGDEGLFAGLGEFRERFANKARLDDAGAGQCVFHGHGVRLDEERLENRIELAMELGRPGQI